MEELLMYIFILISGTLIVGSASNSRDRMTNLTTFYSLALLFWCIFMTLS